MSDTLSHHIDQPSHYIAATPQGRRIEVIEVIHAYGLGYDLGNIVKYVTRAGRKTLDPRADLRKAIKYTEFAAAAMQPLGVFLEAAREAAPTPAEIAAAFGLSARLSMALGIALRPFPHRLDMADLAAHLRAALEDVEAGFECEDDARRRRVKASICTRIAADAARESGEISEIEHARRVHSLRTARARIDEQHVTDAADTVGGDVVPASSRTTLADIIGTCERAAFRMGLEACDPPSGSAGSAPDRAPAQAPDGPAPSRWTNEQDAAVLAMHAGGMSALAIAAVVDIAPEAIQQRLLWLTMPKPHQRSA